MTMAVTTMEPGVLDLGPEIGDTTGIREVSKGLVVEVLEKRGFKKHRNFKASLPASRGVENGFDTGPVFAIYAENSHVDAAAGLTIANNQVIRQTAVVRKLIDNYETPSPRELASAREIDPSQIILPLASQRNRNYCRWWLDSMAKLFICGRSSLLRSKIRGGSLAAFAGDIGTQFQRDTLDMLNWKPGVQQGVEDRFLYGRSINTAGLTFGGGQRIGAIIKEMPYFLDLAFPTVPRPNGAESSRLLYVSRSEASMRLLANEAEIAPGLKDMGFRIMNPAAIPLSEQIEAFRSAKVVVAVHGAGLTNMIFCRPDTTLVEIFPEGGVHGSAFLRISSQLGFKYYFVVGEKIANAQGRKNPNNSNLRLEKDAFFGFLREVLADS